MLRLTILSCRSTVASSYLDYLTNVQTILQEGIPTVDVAIYHGAINGVKGGYSDQTLNQAGYSYGFISDGLLSRDDAFVSNGQLWNAGPGYKALIVNEVTAMSLWTSQKLLQLAQQGLKIILIGDAPAAIPGLPPRGTSLREVDIALQAVFRKLARSENFVCVENTAGLPAALYSCGIG